MTGDRDTGRTLGPVNLVLGAVLLGVVAALVIVLVQGPSPQAEATRGASQRYAAVKAATSKEVAAFLDVDYRDMDPLIAKVLAGATGKFRAQYSHTKVNLKAAAEAAKSVSTGKVRQVGLTDVGASTATVFVAADAVVKNSSTGKQRATKQCPHAGAVCRYYRLKIEMTHTAQGWKMSGLDFVS
ncbi:hypothetical protein [Nocardioides terrisoli]|uniref:hypothetical protein n=1 Tax=Nocardioides terrisoli TaxID=3388267 RepID=UPI00287BB190|nr:hypothetical protein [Nocardioides marmorisolisilvae]